MTNFNSLLSSYQALMQNHANQFDPEIVALQQQIDARIQELRDSEQTLVEAQATQLKNITDALAEDARCLLSTSELKAYVSEYKKINTRRWYGESRATIDDEPTTWLLANFLPVSLSNYQTEEDHDAYDDERTHILYKYFLSLKLDENECQIEVPYKRVYNLDECRETSLKDQIDFYIYDYVEELFDKIECLDEQKKQLVAEISVLIGYANTLFSLKPRIINFEYKSVNRN